MGEELEATTATHRTLLTSMVQLDLELTDRLTTFLYGAPNLCQKADWRWLGFGENVDMICSHSFLRDENLLRTIDDEIPS